MDMLERLRGPHEWGYRDVTDGAFIPDAAPYSGADEIERLRDLLDCALTEHEGHAGKLAPDFMPEHWSHEARAAITSQKCGEI